MKTVQRAAAASAAATALLVVCIVAPPEVYGLGLAASGILVAIAAATSSARSAVSASSPWVWAGLVAAAFAVRIAIAPGAAVEPVVVMLLAAMAGIAAAAAPVPLDRAGGAIAAAVALVGARALYEAAVGLSASAGVESDAAIANRLSQGRPYAGFVTPAALGCFLVMALPCVVLWARERRGLMRIAGTVSAIAGTAALLATRSVTAMAALGGAVALAAVSRRVSTRLVVVAGIVLGLGIGAAALVRPDAVTAPFRADSPWRLRAGNVRIALEIARDHPLLGAGPAGYGEAFPAYRQPGDNESQHAHDLPAELIADFGIPAGLVMSAVFFILFLGPLLRRGNSFRSSGEGVSEAVPSGFAVGLAAFALHNLADFTAFMPSLLLIAAVARGWLAEPRAEGEEAAPAGRLAWSVLAVVLAAVAAGAGLSREALHDARQAAIAGDRPAAAAGAARAEKLAPWDPDPAQFSAEAALASQPPDAAAALAVAERAVGLAPQRASVRRTRAHALAASGDTAGAYADLVEASRLYPMQPAYATERDGLGVSLQSAARGASH
ncbi:MAG TPA: O-antigen ligase family protein [Candidatus Polarisedimenticolaceae bacterium]|nr:O-antigen ligase family protein [Candidatus Polarisedimenticolaceae bacterium]